MAREKLRKFRCLNEDFIFEAPLEYVAKDAGEEEDHRVIEWVPGQSYVPCPHDPLHRVELLEG
jgi:hypothetical protein